MTQPDIIEAVVQVGARETRYLRCGRGERVVVVLAGQEDERLRLMRRYAVGHCVIAPVPHQADAAPAAAADALEQWLRGVIDGLGLDVPAVVLTPEYAWLAERLAGGCEDVLEGVTQDC